MTNNARTTCLVVGGGPAGMVLGLLTARAGVEVTVLENHAGFLRALRGHTPPGGCPCGGEALISTHEE